VSPLRLIRDCAHPQVAVIPSAAPEGVSVEPDLPLSCTVADLVHRILITRRHHSHLSSSGSLNISHELSASRALTRSIPFRGFLSSAPAGHAAIVYTTRAEFSAPLRASFDPFVTVSRPSNFMEPLGNFRENKLFDIRLSVRPAPARELRFSTHKKFALLSSRFGTMRL
jgi:hypothetical protein